MPRDENYASLAGFLAARFPPHDPEQVAQLMARGDVFSSDGLPLTLDAEYRPGGHIWVFRPLPEEPSLSDEIPVLYEDDDLLVVDKPHGLPVTPRGGFVKQTAVTKLRVRTGNQDLSPVHRLDRLTAGVLIFAKTPRARGPLQTLFELQQVRKTYELIAPLNPHPESDAPERLPQQPEEPIRVRSRIVKDSSSLQAREVDGPANAVTGIRLIREFSGTPWGLYAAYPLSGKTHQIRVHMNHLGRPLLGDPLYPSIDDEALRHPETRLQLLAREISLRHPFTGDHLSVRSDRTLEIRTRPEDA